MFIPLALVKVTCVISLILDYIKRDLNCKVEALVLLT